VRREDGIPIYELSGPSSAIARRPETKKPIEDYLKTQGRFRHIFRPERDETLLKYFQENIDHRWNMLLKKVKGS
jgi:pyruvate ferredoxin oxidoreductase beta subunit